MVTITFSKIVDESDTSASKLFTYTIKNFQNLHIGLRTPVSPMPLPEDTADENVLVKMEGNTKTVHITWTLADSATSLIGGTKSDSIKTVKTVAEQVNFLLNTMQGFSLTHRFSIKINYSEIGGTDLIFYGFVNDIDFDTGDSTPVTFVANLDLIVGKVITTLDGDIASPPTNLSLVAPAPGGGAGRITASWTAPSYKGGSGVIDTYDLEFMSTTTGYSDYKKYGQGSSPFTTPTSSLTSGAKYTFRVRAISVDGEGKWSDWLDLNPTTASPDGVACTTS